MIGANWVNWGDRMVRRSNATWLVASMLRNRLLVRLVHRGKWFWLVLLLGKGLLLRVERFGLLVRMIVSSILRWRGCLSIALIEHRLNYSDLKISHS